MHYESPTVVETNVEYPTDVRLLLDAPKWLVAITGLAFEEFGLAGWRRRGKLQASGRRLLGRVRKAKQCKRNPRRVKRCLKFAKELVERALESLEELAEAGVRESRLK